ncbi:phospholipid-binding lipoprotein MlaA [Crenobacter luteus]|uniref:MlaA family lipoprotein n=1 Tax=Crenobacter luteus TaxID=1452487 RepID=UPI0010EB468F|nr:VacJ family lipoprotein [Crenobacter luteus]TCP13572.1 phospholipid-binding lipoprotein MlaA [Crenobacter luteus]
MSARRLLAVAGLAVLLLGGCASAPANPHDPFEPFNRAVYRFNDTADRAVVKPVAEGYRAIAPQPVRTGVGNFFNNWLDAYSAISNLLRVDVQKALNDIMRVSLNTTFGLAGLLDVATPAGLVSNKNTLGDTFASWGWKHSSYLVLPILGPSTVRDGLGAAAYFAADPYRHAFGTETRATVAGVLNGVSTRERYLGLEETVDEAALDPYSFVRDGYLQLRAREIGVAPPASRDDDLDLDQLMEESTPPAGASDGAQTPGRAGVVSVSDAGAAASR